MGAMRSLTWARGVALLLILGLASLFLPAPGYLPASDVARTVLLLARVATLLLAPGLALILVLRPFAQLDILQTIALGPMASLALFPLLLFWVSLAGGEWNAGWVRLFLVVAVAVAVWRLWGRARPWPRPDRATVICTGALGAVFLLALATRLYLIKGIPYPAWVDSYHHTIITQIVLDTGRVPSDYRPYASLSNFIYHFGFHAWSAFVSWATGLAAHRAVLWGGQVLNTLTVLSVFFFVDRLARDRRAGLVAAVIAGLVCRMPSYYVNFGRYPQLAGQVLLPVAVVATVEACHRQKTRWRSILATALLVAGLGLTHYRVAIFYLASLVPLALAALVLKPFSRSRLLWSALWLVCVGLAALVLVSPFLPSFLGKTVALARRAAPATSGTQYDYITLDFIRWAGLRTGMLIALGLAVAWLLFRLRQLPLGGFVLLWLGVIIFLANPVVSGTPSGFFTNGTVILALYLPASVLVGLAAGDGLAGLERWVTRRYQNVRGRHQGRTTNLAFALALLVLSGWGIQDKLSHGLEPGRYLVSNSDLWAADWIMGNTPSDAVFAVGAEFWLPSSAVGNDGGYWLPYTARRRTILPPMIYCGEAEPVQVARTNACLHDLIDARSPEELGAAMKQAGADYIYGGNRVKQPWQDLLTDEAHFEKVYQREGIRIYRHR